MALKGSMRSEFILMHKETYMAELMPLAFTAVARDSFSLVPPEPVSVFSVGSEMERNSVQPLIFQAALFQTLSLFAIAHQCLIFWRGRSLHVACQSPIFGQWICENVLLDLLLRALFTSFLVADLSFFFSPSRGLLSDDRIARSNFSNSRSPDRILPTRRFSPFRRFSSSTEERRTFRVCA